MNWTSDEKEDILNILIDISDLGYQIFFRTVDHGIYISKLGEYDEEFGGSFAALINYDEICESLIEAVDRLRDKYEVEISFSNTLTDRAIKYHEVPGNIRFPCVAISLILSPKSTFGRIKNFLKFNPD